MVTWERIILCNNPECRKEISRAPVRDVDVYQEMIGRTEIRPSQVTAGVELIDKGQPTATHLCGECLSKL